MPSDCLKLNLRNKGRATSITLRKDIVGIWIVLNGLEHEPDILGEVVEFTQKCLDSWEEESAKGFSSFVLTKMIQEVVSVADFESYKDVVQSLGVSNGKKTKKKV